METNAEVGYPCVPMMRPFFGIINASQAGRFLNAAQDIKAGQAIVREEPYAAVLLRPLEKSHCHHCFKLEAALIP